MTHPTDPPPPADGPVDLRGALVGGRYRVENQLFVRGEAEVYRAMHLALERSVTIKFLPPMDGSKELLKRRLEREARALARLDHPSIVRALDVGVHRKRPYLVRETVRGQTVAEHLARGERFDWATTQRAVEQLAEAIAHAHAAGVLLREISPETVVMTSDGRFVITELGLARFLEPEAGDELTLMGAPVAETPYLSPEQRAGASADPRADLYSLGALAYQMTSGAMDDASTLAGVPLEVVEFPPEAERLVATIDRLLRVDPIDRFRSALDVLDALHGKRRVDETLFGLPEDERPTRELRITEDDRIEIASLDRADPGTARSSGVEERAPAAEDPALTPAVSESVPAPSMSSEARRLTRSWKVMALAAAALLALVVAVVASSGDSRLAVEAEAILSPPSAEDRELLALARSELERKQHDSALEAYRRLANQEPRLFEARDIDALLRFLSGSRNERAEAVLLALKDRAVPALRTLFEDRKANRRARRRAGEVLLVLGQPADLVPLYTELLAQDDCEARRFAIRRLEAFGDRRALPALNRLASSGSWLHSECGADEAGRAAARIAKTTPAPK